MSEVGNVLHKKAVRAMVALPALVAFYLATQTLPWTAASVDKGDIGSTLWSWLFGIAAFTAFAIIIKAFWPKNMHPIEPEDALLGFEMAAG